MHFAFEGQLDKEGNKLHHDINGFLKESHTAWRVRIASHGNSSDEITAAVTEVHRAWLKELQTHNVPRQ
eukprot:10334599-Karenia_brevis.AAC.1